MFPEIKVNKNETPEAPTAAQRIKNPTQCLVSTRMCVGSLSYLSRLRIRHCCELWHRLQMWPGSCIAGAVVQTSSYSSDSTLSLGTSICYRCSVNRKKKKKRRRRRRKKKHSISDIVLSQRMSTSVTEDTLCFCPLSRTVFLI